MDGSVNVFLWQDDENKTMAFARSISEVMPGSLAVKPILDYNSPYGHLLPDGRGGGGIEILPYAQWIEVGLAFTSVTAFVAFVNGFVGETAKLLAQQLFAPMSKEQREAAITKEKALRARWKERFEAARDYRKESSLESWNEQEQANWFYWQAWGEAGRTLEYNANYRLQIHIAEKQKTHSVLISFKGHDYEYEHSFSFIDNPEKLKNVLEKELSTLLQEVQPETK